MFKFCLNNVLRFFLIIMKILLNILIITILSINLSSADELQVFNFTETELAELKVRKVRGADNKTLYTLGTNDNGNYLKSVADNAASVSYTHLTLPTKRIV